MRVLKTLALCCLALSNGSLLAAPITSISDSLLSGATVIAFDEVALGAADPTISGVTFTGQSVATLTQANTLVPTSPFLGNNTSAFAGTDVVITFATGVTAFGANLFSVNTTSTFQAFDALNNLLGSIDLLASGLPVDGFIGLGGFSTTIASVKLITTDYLGIDDFRFVSANVPEPETMALLAMGLVGLGLRRRRKAS